VLDFAALERIFAHSLHAKADGHAKQKPQKRIKRANLPEYIAGHAAVIPNIHLERTVDQHAHAKFHGGYGGGASGGTQKNIFALHFRVKRTNRNKASSACNNHRKMGSAAPQKLYKPIAHTAQQKFNKAFLPLGKLAVKNAP
jgi:hypothetical protein